MTFEDVSLLVPFKSDGGIRQKNWEWLRKRYETILPGAQICIGESDDELYSRAKGINAAARKATRKIFVIVDADIIFEAEHIQTAIVLLSKFPWVIPYTHMVKLTQEMSEALLGEEPSTKVGEIDLSKCEVLSFYPMGGICVMTKEVFEKSGGFDERFKGWGGEDDAFQRMMDWLIGKHGRLGDVMLWHLYHPKQMITDQYYSVNRVLLFEKAYASYEQIVATNDYLKKENGFNK